MSPNLAVGSYPAFSPLPTASQGFWAVVFCYIVPAVADSFPLENMLLCVARTFLLPLRGGKRQTALLHDYVDSVLDFSPRRDFLPTFCGSHLHEPVDGIHYQAYAGD